MIRSLFLYFLILFSNQFDSSTKIHSMEIKIFLLVFFCYFNDCGTVDGLCRLSIVFINAICILKTIYKVQSYRVKCTLHTTCNHRRHASFFSVHENWVWTILLFLRSTNELFMRIKMINKSIDMFVSVFVLYQRFDFSTFEMFGNFFPPRVRTTISLVAGFWFHYSYLHGSIYPNRWWMI